MGSRSWASRMGRGRTRAGSANVARGAPDRRIHPRRGMRSRCAASRTGRGKARAENTNAASPPAPRILPRTSSPGEDSRISPVCGSPRVRRGVTRRTATQRKSASIGLDQRMVRSIAARCCSGVAGVAAPGASSWRRSIPAQIRPMASSGMSHAPAMAPRVMAAISSASSSLHGWTKPAESRISPRKSPRATSQAQRSGSGRCAEGGMPFRSSSARRRRWFRWPPRSVTRAFSGRPSPRPDRICA